MGVPFILIATGAISIRRVRIPFGYLLCYNKRMQLLLVSSSFVSGKGYLEHCGEAVKRFLEVLPAGEVLFVPYASTERYWDKYSASGEKFFGDLGQPYRSIHTCDDPVAYIADAQVKMIFVGGGNTFLLIKTLQDKGLIDPIRNAIRGGAGYMGTSAGSNVACPTMQTTNDMPIVEPSSFQALGLVDFQINAHFVPGSLMEGHKGETREQRINEYHEVNAVPVIGLPELCWIRVEDETSTLGGGADAVVFEAGRASRPWAVNTQLRL
jgi:dipeptidase E